MIFLRFLLQFFVSLVILQPRLTGAECQRSITKTSGRFAPLARKLCSGQVIFEENFDAFNDKMWQHDVNMFGGGVSTNQSNLLFKIKLAGFLCYFQSARLRN